MKRILRLMLIFVLLSFSASAQLFSASSQLFINEVSHRVPGSNYIELYWAGNSSLLLNGYNISKDGSGSFTLNGFGVDPLVRYQAIDESQLGFSLGNSGTLRLTSPNGTSINVLSYLSIPINFSQGRFPDGSNNVVNMGMTRAAANNNNGPSNNSNFGDKLEITDLEINGNNFDDGDTEDDIKPGDRVTIELTVENTFSGSNGLDIEDIDVEVTIENIDDGDDIDFDSDNSFDLDAGDDEDIELDFIVPYEVEDSEEYDITIEVTGDDENGTTHKDVIQGKLEINKEKHLIKLTRTSVAPIIVGCSRDISFDLEVTNLGEDKEKKASLKIVNNDLGLDRSFNFELDDDPSDNDFDLDFNFVHRIDANVDAGSYPIEIKTFYDLNRLSDTVTQNIVVEECEKSPVKDIEKDDDTVQVIFGNTNSEESRENNINIVIILAGLILLSVIVGGFIIKKLSTK